MKGAMYLTENLPIQYKLSSFTQKNLELIEDHWEDTKKAISDSIKLISNYGVTDKNLVTRLPLLPIAQYLRNRIVPYLSSSTPSRSTRSDQYSEMAVFDDFEKCIRWIFGHHID